jgi:hypothetical protein
MRRQLDAETGRSLRETQSTCLKHWQRQHIQYQCWASEETLDKDDAWHCSNRSVDWSGAKLDSKEALSLCNFKRGFVFSALALIAP